MSITILNTCHQALLNQSKLANRLHFSRLWSLARLQSSNLINQKNQCNYLNNTCNTAPAHCGPEFQLRNKYSTTTTTTNSTTNSFSMMIRDNKQLDSLSLSPFQTVKTKKSFHTQSCKCLERSHLPTQIYSLSCTN